MREIAFNFGTLYCEQRFLWGDAVLIARHRIPGDGDLAFTPILFKPRKGGRRHREQQRRRNADRSFQTEAWLADQGGLFSSGQDGDMDDWR